MKTIYLVIEQGAGIVHKSFESILDATEFATNKHKETGFDVFEVQPLEFEKTKLRTIEELGKSGIIKTPY